MFLAVIAALYMTMSVGCSVGPSVGPSVGVQRVSTIVKMYINVHNAYKNRYTVENIEWHAQN